MSTELITYDEIQSIGKTFAASGYFADARDMAQAVVKIMAGRELGLGPVASMTGVYIVKGRPALSANLLAGCLKRSGRYDYRVIELSDKAAEIAYYQGKEEIGRSRFTLDDAKKAGTQNMDKFARNMLFARAMTNGIRWFAPDVFAGGVYTPEELGALVNGEGEVIDAEPTKVAEIAAKHQPTPKTQAELVGPDFDAPPAVPPEPNASGKVTQKMAERWHALADEADSLGITYPAADPYQLTVKELTARAVALKAAISAELDRIAQEGTK